jgi:hypothetical protein
MIQFEPSPRNEFFMASMFISKEFATGQEDGHLISPAARRLGAELFERHHSDYWMQAERPNAVWPEARDDAIGAEVRTYDDI